MRRFGKKYRAAREAVAAKSLYALDEALEAVARGAYAKFDETVELALRLGVDPKHADQMVRGTVVLPHGLGKTKRVLVIAAGDKQKEGQDAGAEYVGGEDMVAKIQAGTLGGEIYEINLANGGIVIEFNDGFDLPADVRAKADAAIAGIGSGAISTDV